MLTTQQDGSIGSAVTERPEAPPALPAPPSDRPVELLDVQLQLPYNGETIPHRGPWLRLDLRV